MGKRLVAGLAVTAMTIAGLAAPAFAQQGPYDPPSCERGQDAAARNAFDKRVDFAQFLRHRSKERACMLGFPPRSGG